mgnify:CR=1 FL=1
MNIAFWILVVIFLVLIWIGLCFLFKPLGRLFFRIFTDIEETMTDEEDIEEEEDEVE